MNSIGIDVGKKICRASIKDEHGRILDELSFSNDAAGIGSLLSTASRYGDARAVVESTGNMWMRIHDTLEDHGIETVLANPVKTKLIAQAKIKSDNHNEPFAVRLVQPSHLFFSRGWHTTIRGSNPIFQVFAPTKRVPYSSFGVETPVALPGMKLLVG